MFLKNKEMKALSKKCCTVLEENRDTVDDWQAELPIRHSVWTGRCPDRIVHTEGGAN